MKIAEKVDEAWHAYHGSGDIEVPMSVVAALSLCCPPPGKRDKIAVDLLGVTPEEFADAVRQVWHMYIRARPDLVNRVWPLVEPWEDTERPMQAETVRAAKTVADAALKADVFALCDETRWEVDLLGTVLTQLRPQSAIQGRGQYYTPNSVAEAMAAMLGVRGGESVNDPSCGTGGMFRAMALDMRRQGRDPASMYWEGNDIDYLAVSCCAVNVVLWGLGYKVLLGVGDSLAADWRKRALTERAETIRIARDGERLRTILGLTRANPVRPAPRDDEPEPATRVQTGLFDLDPAARRPSIADQLSLDFPGLETDQRGAA